MKIIDMEKRGGVFVPVRGSDDNQRKGSYATPRLCINSRPHTIKRQVWSKTDKKQLDAFLSDVTAEIGNFANAVETILRIFK